MADYPYTQASANLKKFLGHIQSAGVPPKVTQKYLEQCGFKSTNDRRIISVLKAIDFIDQSGTPTAKWKAYRPKKQAPLILAKAIRSSYADLFTTFPEAHKRDEEALRNFFSAKTDLGAKAIGLTVNTFKALCELANFEGVSPTLPTSPVTPQESPTIPVSSTTSKSGVVVNINIELTIPATDKSGVYDKFFAAMKKNLLSDE